MTTILNEAQINYIAKLLHGRISSHSVKNKYIKAILKESNISPEQPHSNIQDITNVLKYDFPTDEVKKGGITFTPLQIINYMYKDVLSLEPGYVINYKIADLSVGNGAFLIGLILLLKEQYPDMSIVNFIENNLYGYDIKKENIYFTKLNLSLLALYYGENPEKINFNIFRVDTLKYFKNNVNINNKFDLIVGNPPYVKQQNLVPTYRNFLLSSFETITSNYNLYYAFLELSIKLLNKNGISLQLVPNYLLKIKSAGNLRDYLLKNNHIKKIVNFNANKLFNGIDTYSMVIELGTTSNKILYKSLPNGINSLEYLKAEDWRTLSSSNITQDSINLITDKEEYLVKQVQSQLYTLNISTGIATQRDKLFLIDNDITVSNKYMLKTFNNKSYLIEKESVVKIYKGSGQKKGHLKPNYIIYPYLVRDNIATLKSTDYLSKNEPKTYSYFLDAKNDLSKRSGIKAKDPQWYKYGRTQSLTRFNTKILFPTNSLEPNFNLIKDNALFFNGYAIYGLNETCLTMDEFKALEIILNSKLMKIFMLCTSYFIGSGYVSYQKKYIEKFTVPYLQRDDILTIIELDEKNKLHQLNEFIFKLYNLNYSDFT